MVLLSFSPAWAEAGNPVTVAELQNALAKYQAIENLEVDFKQTKILKDIQLQLKSEGHLSLSPPGRVEWKILRPQPLSVILVDQKVTMKSASGTEEYSQAENPSAKDRRSLSSMLIWLKLDAKAIAQSYEVTEMASHLYRFVAKDTHEPVVKALEMKMDESGHVANLLFEEVSGDSIQLAFSKPNITYQRHISQ